MSRRVKLMCLALTIFLVCRVERLSRCRLQLGMQIVEVRKQVSELW
jgi:hypothetical protein